MLCVESFEFPSKVVFQFRSTVSDMDLCVPQNSVPSHSSGSLTLAAIIIDETLPPEKSKTFQKYTQTVFIPHVHSPVETIKRLDIVWDIYKVEKSLQEAQEGCVRQFHVNKVEKLSCGRREQPRVIPLVILTDKSFLSYHIYWPIKPRGYIRMPLHLNDAIEWGIWKLSSVGLGMILHLSLDL